jgi:hypothetical protein
LMRLLPSTGRTGQSPTWNCSPTSPEQAQANTGDARRFQRWPAKSSPLHRAVLPGCLMMDREP